MQREESGPSLVAERRKKLRKIFQMPQGGIRKEATSGAPYLGALPSVWVLPSIGFPVGGDLAERLQGGWLLESLT